LYRVVESKQFVDGPNASGWTVHGLSVDSSGSVRDLLYFWAILGLRVHLKIQVFPMELV